MWFAISGAFDFLQTYNSAITALATVAIGVFTCFLVKVTNRQARLTRTAIELGTREFLATHRPKIRIRYIEGPPVTNEIPVPTAIIVAANVGNTDAVIVGSGIASFIQGNNFDADPKEMTRMIVPCGSEARITVSGTERLTATQLAQIGVRSATLRMFGIIRYEDGNKTVRNTSFYRVYDPTYGRFTRAREHDHYAEREYED
jgi:hypothetical protein